MTSKLLVAIGCLEDEDHIKTVVKNVEAGIDKWMTSMPLDDQEEIVHILNSIPSMKSIPNRNAEDGTVISRYKGRILDSTVLISPTIEKLNDELIDLFLTAPPKCLIAYGGFVTEDSADWILQDGLFSFNIFLQIFKDSKVVSALSDHSTKVTTSCCELGLWKTAESVSNTESKFTLEIMDSQPSFDTSGGGDHSSDTSEKKQSKFEEFSTFLEEGISNEIGGIFNTLKPPLQEGFLKIRHPCLYIFPGGYGDSAFFAVNGFNMLVNGGSCTKPWFWKLIQHLDRVDSVLATHLGSDNLPGLNSLLLRKLQERQVKLPMDCTTPEYQEMKRCLISPDLGPIFMNAPKKLLENVSKSNESPKSDGATKTSIDNAEKRPIQKTVDIVKDTMRLSKALNLEIVPLTRKSSIEPITLFSKVGLGHLEMYVISPAEGSKEIVHINEKWGGYGKTSSPSDKTVLCDSAKQEVDSNVTNLSSVCALLVWHPNNPNEKIVRVLFPGNASQAKIFEGLDSLRNLPFLKGQYVTKNILNKQKSTSKVNGAATAQKPSRPVNAANLGKKPTSAATMRKGPVPAKKEAPVKKEAPAKHTEKRPRPERPSKAKPVSSTSMGATAKTSVKEKATSKSVKTDPDKQSKSASSLTKRPASARTAPVSKPEMKRAGTTVSSKSVPKTKATSASAVKVVEKAKKPQALAASKQKSEGLKTTPKKSSRPPMKKGTPVSKLGDKTAKKEKISPAKIAQTPPEDLTADFAKLEVAKEEGPSKPTELLSVGSEEPTSSALSDRHSPEGEDGSTAIQYAEAPTLPQNEKLMPEKEDEQRPQDQEDTGFVIMSKQDIISEDSDMISTNGSSAAAQHTPVEDAILLETRNEVELISSDKSTPEEENQEPQEVEKVIKFSEPEADQAHKPVERIPTPFHSLQESSVTSEPSPVSESENGVAEAAASHSPQQERKMEIPTEIETEKLPDTIGVENGVESSKTADIMPEEIQEDIQNGFPPEENAASLANIIEPMPAEKNLPDAHEKNDVESCKETGNEVRSSLNSSVEGSYELYPVERSPPPASAQETIAETISDFKHDEPTAVEDLQEEPSTFMDTQPQQEEMFEDPTVSTEAPDAHYSLSTTSTGSQHARIEPPFSTSDAGLPSVAVDQPVPMQQDHVEAQKSEDPENQDEMPEVDQGVGRVLEEDKEVSQGSEAEDDVMLEELKTDHDQMKNNDDEEREVQLPLVDEKRSHIPDENFDIVEEGDLPCKAQETEILENYPQQAWSTPDEPEFRDNVEFSGEQGVQNEEIKDDAELLEDFEIHSVEPEQNQQHILSEIPDAVNIQDLEESPPSVPAVEVSPFVVEEDEEHIEMTGSLASSAQDQEDSQPTSSTETADLSEIERCTGDGGIDDGPNLKEYENIETGAIPKSDLLLASVEENFTLHGGSTTEQDLLQFDNNHEELLSFPETDIHGSAQSTDLLPEEEDESVVPRKYQPAYLNPSAPLADTEEVQTGIDQLKAAELFSPLDVHAKPFIPKSSISLEPSPTCDDADVQFGQGDTLVADDALEECAPASPSKRSLADLMSSNQQNLLDMDDPCLPPSRGQDPCASQDKTSKPSAKKAGHGPTSATKSAACPIYLDLAYVPSHGNKNSVGKEFFQRIRAKYYVISGINESRDEPSAQVLDHLLEGRRSWFSEQASTSSSDNEDNNVTVIPTHDSQTLREWYKQNFKELESCNIHMVASGSKVMVQVESIEACKIEF